MKTGTASQNAGFRNFIVIRNDFAIPNRMPA